MKTQIIDYRPLKIAELIVLTGALFHWATPLSQRHVYSNQVLGIILGIGGFGVTMWWLFKRFGTAICPSAKADDLGTSEIYRVSRNPMYLGVVFRWLRHHVALFGYSCWFKTHRLAIPLVPCSSQHISNQ